MSLGRPEFQLGVPLVVTGYGYVKEVWKVHTCYWCLFLMLRFENSHAQTPVAALTSSMGCPAEL
eukprot:scaffold126110_cov22-Tisochrysis_lutea.AAC.4